MLFRTSNLALIVVSLMLGACGVGNTGEETDPIAVDNAVAFIKRPLLFDEDDGELIADDLREPAEFRPGARLFIKDRASPSASARDITSAQFSGDYDVRDLSASYDGTKLLFSMRAPEIENADEEDQPKWNIWEYDIEAGSLRRIISSDTTAEAGHDISPSYLADGRILFTSTRQRTSKAILLDENKPQFAALEEERDVEAFVLHVMDADGQNIEQITFNQSHDLDPIVLQNGKVLFSRWDNAGQTGANGMNLYQVNPDGTGLTYLYGRHSHDSGEPGDTVQYANPIEDESGDVIVRLREFVSDSLGSLPVRVDLDNFVEADIATDGSNGNGQAAIVSGVTTGSSGPSLNGQYGAAFPLYDGTNRYLVSWSVCRIQLINNDPMQTNTNPIEACTAEKLASGNYEAAPPLYGLWILDAGANTLLPIETPQEGQQFEEAVIMTERTLPTFISASTLDDDAQALADQGYGIIHIRSVYDFDGENILDPVTLDQIADPTIAAPADRPARFLRVEKPVSIPSDEVRDFDNTAFGRSNAQSMREILGYVPVEPDGSVKVAVPANVAFAISVLDEDGQRFTGRHQNWLTVRPGETVECIGCHTANSEVPHGRDGAGPEALNTGAPTTGLAFPNTDTATVPFADMGETMAEAYARANTVRRLTPDIVFDDEWTDDALTPKATSFSYAYADLETPSPVTPGSACDLSWTALCRIVINYETHIHPLWSADRRVFDVDEVTVLDDRTCTSCHTSVDDMNNTIVAVADLDLTDGPSTDEPDHFKSYRELLFPDNAQEVVDGILVDIDTTDELTAIPQFDNNGDPILDPDTGEQVVIYQDLSFDPQVIPATMRTAGALQSGAFLDLFRAGGSHAGDLSAAELKLISEWLDLGAQYYNNPFDAPAN